MYCTVCGGECPDDAKFCIYCGAPLNAPQPPAGTDDHTETLQDQPGAEPSASGSAAAGPAGADQATSGSAPTGTGQAGAIPSDATQVVDPGGFPPAAADTNPATQTWPPQDFTIGDGTGAPDQSTAGAPGAFPGGATPDQFGGAPGVAAPDQFGTYAGAPSQFPDAGGGYNVPPTNGGFPDASAYGGYPAPPVRPPRRVGPIVAAVCAVLAVIAVTVVATLALINPSGGSSIWTNSVLSPNASQTSPATGSNASGAGAPTRTKLNLHISQVDNADFPQVTLYASVADDSGATVSSPDPAQFQVVEVGGDGQEHTATINQILPVTDGGTMNINLVLDQSGSMSDESKMSNAKSAANAFIDEIANSGSGVAEITSFDSYVYNRQPFTSDTSLLKSAVSSLQPYGQTAFYDALYWALQRTNLKSGSRVVIAFTDGQENSSTYSLSDVEQLSKLTGIPVYIVGVGNAVDAPTLKSLAQACNGSYYDAATTDLAKTLQDIYNGIYQDQRSMYRVVYTSNFTDSETSFRTVRLDCPDSSQYEGSTESTYMPVDNVSQYDNTASTQDYVLADSSSRYYSRSELEQMSLWDLYLARNEIFARHGRGFKNQDLRDYFATRRWYHEQYGPEEFDALPNQLNDYEMKNTDLMLQIEKERNSPYLTTSK